MERTGYYSRQSGIDIRKLLTNVMTGVYLYMFIGLFITAASAYFAYQSETFMNTLLSNPALFYGLLIGELVLVFALSASLHRLPYAANLTLFMLYALVNGLTLSVIFIAYTTASVYSSFLVTCLTFGIMSAIGYFTKRNLTSVGNYLLMGLIGIIIAGIINIFIMNDIFSFFITVIGLFIFIGLTAYDTQKIKNLLENQSDEILFRNFTIMGALTLYLDFINIFLRILRLAGKRK